MVTHKGKHLIAVAYSLRGLVYIDIMVEHGGMQAEIMAEKELRVLHLFLTGSELCHWE